MKGDKSPWLGIVSCQRLYLMLLYSDDNVLVGRAAVAQQETNAANTLYDAKRFIGKKFTTEELQKESSRYQFKVILAISSFPLVSCLKPDF